MEIKNREKALFIAVGVGLVLLVGNYLVLNPLVRSWHDRSQRIADLTARLNSGNQLLARGPAVLERWDRMQSNSLPSTASLAESKLLNAFDGWVRDSGVAQGSFRPQLKETDDNYSTLECRADVSGDMQGILNFLYDLEKDPTALKLDSVELTARDDTGRQLALVLEMSGLMLPAPQP
ncbi:MAG TPA: hypothetical protein VHB20_19095 [Verrucomicrobiae bacterium]|jgi:Tfp pilus assembly protein PilO|nr:hypothetical protein [Verrucomicrobiae bacterium]